MNRLHAELDRLYRVAADPVADGAPPTPLVDAQGRVRALVLELARPADWDVLSKVWQGVQSELALPAPGIAVSGTDGLQLWFSLAQPIAASRARAFLESLRARFLPDVAARRLRLLPDTDANHAAVVPALQEADGNWSAFVAPDLAAVFAETPWLDIAPGDEAQAGLLRGLQSMTEAAFAAAAGQLAAEAAQAPIGAPAGASAPTPPVAAPPDADPRRFLVAVMNDETVALALRIEAAKALLPYGR